MIEVTSKLRQSFGMDSTTSASTTTSDTGYGSMSLDSLGGHDPSTSQFMQPDKRTAANNCTVNSTFQVMQPGSKKLSLSELVSAPELFSPATNRLEFKRQDDTNTVVTQSRSFKSLSRYSPFEIHKYFDQKRLQLINDKIYIEEQENHEFERISKTTKKDNPKKHKRKSSLLNIIKPFRAIDTTKILDQKSSLNEFKMSQLEYEDVSELLIINSKTHKNTEAKFTATRIGPNIISEKQEIDDSQTGNNIRTDGSVLNINNNEKGSLIIEPVNNNEQPTFPVQDNKNLNVDIESPITPTILQRSVSPTEILSNSYSNFTNNLTPVIAPIEDPFREEILVANTPEPILRVVSPLPWSSSTEPFSSSIKEEPIPSPRDSKAVSEFATPKLDDAFDKNAYFEGEKNLELRKGFNESESFTSLDKENNNLLRKVSNELRRRSSTRSSLLSFQRFPNFKNERETLSRTNIDRKHIIDGEGSSDSLISAPMPIATSLKMSGNNPEIYGRRVSSMDGTQAFWNEAKDRNFSSPSPSPSSPMTPKQRRVHNFRFNDSWSAESSPVETSSRKINYDGPTSENIRSRPFPTLSPLRRQRSSGTLERNVRFRRENRTTSASASLSSPFIEGSDDSGEFPEEEESGFYSAYSSISERSIVDRESPIRAPQVPTASDTPPSPSASPSPAIAPHQLQEPFRYNPTTTTRRTPHRNYI